MVAQPWKKWKFRKKHCCRVESSNSGRLRQARGYRPSGVPLPRRLAASAHPAPVLSGSGTRGGGAKVVRRCLTLRSRNFFEKSSLRTFKNFEQVGGLYRLVESANSGQSLLPYKKCEFRTPPAATRQRLAATAFALRHRY